MNQSPARPSTRLTLARSRRFRIALIAVLLAALAGFLHRPLFRGNWGVVDAGRFYRSGQPGGDLAERVAKYGLRSIINLRGGSPADAFYRDEVNTSARLGIDFYDLPLSAGRRPTKAELKAIIECIDRCQYPALVHCKWGADRTGMVCALYRMVKLGDPPEEAAREFSLSHLHIPIGGPERLHAPFAEYAQWLAERGLVHTPERFRVWVDQDYRSEGAPEPPPPIVPRDPRHPAIDPAARMIRE